LSNWASNWSVRDELPSFGHSVDDLLLARVVVAVEFHAEIVDFAQRLAGRKTMV
jgi:hypothetical protein